VRDYQGLGLLAAVALLLLLFPFLYILFMRYIGLPLRAIGKRQMLDPDFVSVEIPGISEKLRVYHERGARQLAPLGFVAAAHLHGAEHIPYSDSYVSAWLNAAEGSSAQIISVVVRNPALGIETVNSIITLCTEFADQTAIVTSSAGKSVFVPDPLCDTIRWPMMNDAEVLYRLHHARVARSRQGRETLLPPADGVTAYIRLQNVKTFQRQVDAGYFRLVADQGAIAKTLKGAFFMYWKLLWPWKQIQARTHLQKLRRMLAEVGMGKPEDYPPHPAP
jgi:hypothetical protein